ncbi:hypothetical protein [Calothrix sp. PCC 7507]|uniref:hypothetical protein n=1 Tax=Calothrix sp. PCC 7507 TaxID=99598 RepID=UPI00029EFC3C|nr:hypothetical protein [Calothrix sp. PCC 7507]AFY35521.1 hypothetical protein Cal7507_5180 [Calothrix sp. PCC 7507]
MKSSVYRNAAVLACSLGLLGLLVGCFEMKVSFEATNPDGSASQATEPPQITQNPSSTVADQTLTSVNVSSPDSTPSNQVKDSDRKNNPLIAYNPDPAGNAKAQGTLRMINQTNQPVRLALLVRQSAVKGSKTNYDLPAHWDFAPKEGSEKGLLLSLPNGNLKLEKGDILVAFAQDGSRRYWGPYVVGETSTPQWNSRNREWRLVLSQ